MSGTSLDLGSLSLLVLVVVISCCVATLLSWCWVCSMSPRTFQYCYPCAQQLGVLSAGPQAVLTDAVVARPWVECVQSGGGQQDGKYGHSGTFQRLGMRTARPGIGLEVGQLETRPLSPVPCQEGEEKDSVKKNDVKRRSCNQQLISPASAEVLARRDSVRSLALGCRMSRRTLVFPTQSQHSLQSLARSDQQTGYKQPGTEQKVLQKSSSINSPSNTIVGAETDYLDNSGENAKLERNCQDTKQRQVRRSVSARKEKSRYTLMRRQEDAGLTSQSEDERGAAGPRQLRRHYTGVVDSGAAGAAIEMYQDRPLQIGGFDNPGFVNSQESLNPSHLYQEGHSSVISPTQQQHQSPSNVSPRPGYENVPTIQFPPHPSAADLQDISPPGAVRRMV